MIIHCKSNTDISNKTRQNTPCNWNVSLYKPIAPKSVNCIRKQYNKTVRHVENISTTMSSVARVSSRPINDTITVHPPQGPAHSNVLITGHFPCDFYTVEFYTDKECKEAKVLYKSRESILCITPAFAYGQVVHVRVKNKNMYTQCLQDAYCYIATLTI
jgi:hypothetical protein